MILAFSGSSIISILVFIIILCVLIGLHELGHLLTAKKSNVYCYEYSIGMGPILYRSKKHETHFCIRAIPLGGFVKMAGEENVEDNQTIKDNDGNDIPFDRILSNKPRKQKALVLASGGLVNILIAIFCFYLYICFNDISAFTGNPNSRGFAIPSNTSQIELLENSKFSDLGYDKIVSGDTVTIIQTRYDGEAEYLTFNIKNYDDLTKALVAKAPNDTNITQELIFEFKEHPGETYYLTRSYSDGAIEKIGFSSYYKAYEYNAFTGIFGTFHMLGYYFVETFKALGKIFTGNFSNMSGLVGIYSTVDSVTTANVNVGAKILDYIYLTGAISFSLGFFNLIPFPALDGGRLFFVAIEAITKKKINPDVEATIHFVGFILLIALMIIVNIRDIINLAVMLWI